MRSPAEKQTEAQKKKDEQAKKRQEEEQKRNEKLAAEKAAKAAQEAAYQAYIEQERAKFVCLFWRPVSSFFFAVLFGIGSAGGGAATPRVRTL